MRNSFSGIPHFFYYILTLIFSNNHLHLIITAIKDSFKYATSF